MHYYFEVIVAAHHISYCIMFGWCGGAIAGCSGSMGASPTGPGTIGAA